MMKRWAQWLALGSLAATAWGAPDEAAWQTLDPANLPADWATIMSALQEPDLIRADFAEERNNRLRRRPSTFDGDLIFSREEGLSLHYDSAIDSVIILDRKGVLRRSLNREMTLAREGEDDGLLSVMLEIFNLDLAKLEARFVIEGQLPEEGGWALRLTPREEMENGLAVRRVILEGRDGVLEEIFLDRSASLNVRIRMQDHRMGGELTPTERTERFR